MYLICGLGNPGREYETTRHNMGFLTVDVLAERLGISVKQLRFKALVGEGRIGAEKVMLMKPQTFMNLSGEAVRQAMDYYRLDPSQLMVVYDDADIAVGSIRIRPSGSSGSHNGMKSIIYQLQE
ncbi:MAG: aminoacyl-tRNA hydrolase, partial [Firmicutes bacterium]|nr:aminoacyl-tRNA hydrolase [Bacillota bacterium]